MTSSQPDETLVEPLRRLFDRCSSSLFCVFLSEDTVQEISFQKLFFHAQAYATLFRNRGLKPTDVVFIVLRHRPDLLYAFVGALIGGFIPSFVAPASDRQDPETFAATLRSIFECAGASAAVVDPADFELVAQAMGSVLIPLIAPIGGVGQEEPIAWHTPAPNDVAFLQFSSGTTGMRKGVMLTHQEVLKQIEAYRQVLALGCRDRIAGWLPLYHDMGLIACFVMPLITGIPVVMLDAFEWVNQPARLFDAIERYSATLIWLPNFAFNHLCATVPANSGYDLACVRAFINCSEPCKIESMRRFSSHFAQLNVRMEQLQTCYAMAEATFAVTQSDLGRRPTTLAVLRNDFVAGHRIVPTNDGCAEELLELVSVGRLLPGFALRILSPSRGDLPAGHVGEIAIRGPSLFTGYHRAPEATDDAFADGWYLTGDLGFVHGDDVFVTGRCKDIVIAYGRNYYSHDIEALAGRVGGVKAGRVVAFGVYNAVSGSEEVMVVAETEETDAGSKRRISRLIKSTVAAELGLSVSPALVPVKWLIKTTSGKLSRTLNREKYQKMIGGISNSLAS